MTYIDEKLAKWEELQVVNWQDALLGNGFSINIHHGFGYKNLKEVASRPDIETSLEHESQKLFQQYNTVNFEDILRSLFHAFQVDECLNLAGSKKISHSYENVRKSLAHAVNFSHVPEGFSSANLVSDGLANFKNIFTTNYDLIPYWGIMSKNTAKFKDYMWGQGGSFDIKDTTIYGAVTKVHYLHGGLHLVENIDGTTYKRKSNGLATIRDLFDFSNANSFPLFISEGHWSKKISKINRNQYLRFCYQNFISSNGNLVVLGHSLTADYDQHIIDAIKESRRMHVAISVWRGLSAEEIIFFKSRIRQDLANYTKFIYFFDSDTHPLTSSRMKNLI